MLREVIDYSSKLTGKICRTNGGCTILIMFYWGTQNVSHGLAVLSAGHRSLSLIVEIHLSTGWSNGWSEKTISQLLYVVSVSKQ